MILRAHNFDGTAGASVDPQVEGFDSKDGTEGTYIADGYAGTALHQTTRCAYTDNSTAHYCGFYLRLPSLPSGDVVAVLRTTEATTGNTVALIWVNLDGTVSISSAYTAVATTTTALTAGTWCRIEYHLAAGSQELRLFSSADGSTPTETLTDSTVSADPARWLFGLPLASPWLGGPVDLDQVVLADAWPNLGTSSGQGTYIHNGSQFVRHTPYVHVAGSWQKFDLQ